MKKLYLALVLGMFMISLVSATCIQFFYSDGCPHCQKVKPLILSARDSFTEIEWKFYDMTQPEHSNLLSQYGDGVPLIVLDDDIILSGSQEIPRWLPCYLQDMSTKECPTLSADHSTKDWFIR